MRPVLNARDDSKASPAPAHLGVQDEVELPQDAVKRQPPGHAALLDVHLFRGVSWHVHTSQATSRV